MFKRFTTYFNSASSVHIYFSSQSTLMHWSADYLNVAYYHPFDFLRFFFVEFFLYVLQLLPFRTILRIAIFLSFSVSFPLFVICAIPIATDCLQISAIKSHLSRINAVAATKTKKNKAKTWKKKRRKLKFKWTPAKEANRKLKKRQEWMREWSRNSTSTYTRTQNCR